MSKADSARIFFNAAREEILQRIKLRDQILSVYLVLVSAMLSIALGTISNIEILLSIPFIALGATILISQHNMVIGFLGKFCAKEIGDYLDNLKEPEGAPQWDKSESFKSYSTTAHKLRSWGHSLFILIPIIISLSINYNHAFKSPFPFGVLWWFGLLCLFITIWLILSNYQNRIKLYNERWK